MVSSLVKIKPRLVKLGDGRIGYAEESGRINVQAYNDKNWELSYLANIRYDFNKTPYKLWFGKKSEFKYFRVFG